MADLFYILETQFQLVLHIMFQTGFPTSLILITIVFLQVEEGWVCKYTLMRRILFINIQSQDIHHYGMRQKPLVQLLVQVPLMRYTMILHKVLLLLMYGRAQQLKVLVVLQKIMLDGKYFTVVMFKLLVEHIFQAHQIYNYTIVQAVPLQFQVLRHLLLAERIIVVLKH